MRLTESSRRYKPAAQRSARKLRSIRGDQFVSWEVKYWSKTTGNCFLSSTSHIEQKDYIGESLSNMRRFVKSSTLSKARLDQASTTQGTGQINIVMPITKIWQRGHTFQHRVQNCHYDAYTSTFHKIGDGDLVVYYILLRPGHEMILFLSKLAQRAVRLTLLYPLQPPMTWKWS